jgi:VWFA-related protein
MSTFSWLRRSIGMVGIVATVSVASGFHLRGPSVGSPKALAEAVGSTFYQTSQDQPQRPVFKTEANYVRVDVYPTVNGVPVEDLKQEDFEVLEDRVPQRIDAFQHIRIRAAGPQDTRREPTSVAESRTMMEDPEARLFVIFLDTYHVEVGGSHRIRKPLIDTLNSVIGERDLVGVMTPEMSATDITFARRTATIEGFLTRYWPWGERDQIVSRDPEEDQYRECYPGIGPTRACPDDDRGVAAEMIYRRREKRTIDALEDVVRFLRGLREERKAILAISDGWLLYRPDPNLARQLYCQAPGASEIFVDPRTGKLSKTDPRSVTGASMHNCDRDRINLSQIDDEREFRQILDEANRANASFYPIDPRGLVVFDTPLLDMTGSGQPPPPTPLVVDQKMLQSRLTSLRTLAEATDGLAIVDNNDLASGMKRVVSDLTSYYLLGYYSTGKLDGKFHAITVRVKRPGVQVRARRGYLAATAAEVTTKARASAPTDPGAGAQKEAIELAMAPLGNLTRELPVRLAVVAGWKEARAASFWVVGEVSRGDDWLGGGRADVMLVDASGATVASARATIDPGAHSFRVAVVPSEQIAPGNYEVRVRASATGGGAPASDMVRVALPPAPEASGAVFMRRGPTTGNKEVPTADLRFRRSDRLHVEVPTAAAGPTSARLLDRTGKPVPIPVAANVREDADGSRWLSAELALNPLAPGDYLVEITDGAGAAGSRSQKRTLVAFRVVN